MRTTSIATKPRLGYYRNGKGQLFEATKLHEDRSVTVRRACTGKAIRVSRALFNERFTWANIDYDDPLGGNRPEPAPVVAHDDDARGSMTVVVYVLAMFIAGLCGLLIWCAMKVEW